MGREECLELLELHGLGEVPIEACLGRARAVVRTPVSGEGYECRVSKPRIPPECLRDVVAVDSGQANVQQDHVRPEPRRSAERAVTGVGNADLMPRAAKHLRQDLC